jgi:hypothetical protein
MQRLKPFVSLNDRLRLVLATGADKRQGERLEQVRLCQEALDPRDFRRLFEVDTSWGNFGERIAHYDEQLHVVASTKFVPLERDTACNPDDIVLLLTPIYRVLLSLTAITLKENDFEGYGSRDLFLPHRPRIGTEVGRYISLLEVTCSLWLEVCHVYARPESPTLVDQLYCFNVNRTRANYVWVDYSSTSCEAVVRYTSLASLTTPVCLVQSPQEDIEEVVRENFSLCLQSFASQPWIQLVGASSKLSAFVLLTRDGGTYVSFHRVVEGRLARYPLYFHLMDDTLDDESTRIPSCAVCGRQSTDLIEDTMDMEPGLLYCNRSCIGQMERIRQIKARALEEARLILARKEGLPPAKSPRKA